MAKKKQNSKRPNLTNRRETAINENVDSQTQVSRTIARAIMASIKKGYSRRIVIAKKENSREPTSRSYKRCREAR